MSEELETLDQIAGGDLRLSIVRRFYSDDDSFTRGVLGLLSCGDVRLLAADGVEMPPWSWRELFRDGGVLNQLEAFSLSITDHGAKKV